MNTNTILPEKYDIIVIGSGIGALTVASLAAKFGKKRILIIEQNFKTGGYTHTFKREQKWHWDVGIHYLGDLEDGSLNRKLYDIVSNGKVRWNKMPDEFDKFVYPDRVFGVPSEQRKYEEKLIGSFPEEADSIRQYFKDVKAAAEFGFGFYGGLYAPAIVRWAIRLFSGFIGKDFRNITTAQYMKSRFKNADLRGLLVSQWGDYGLPPAQSSFFIHSMVVNHYLKGAWYPAGGAQVFAEGTEELVHAHGGKILLNSRVTEIMVSDGRATGVKYIPLRGEHKGKEIAVLAEFVVSDAGSYNTYYHLLAEKHAPGYRQGLLDFMKRYPHTTSVSLFIGFKGDPRTLGFQGENHWVYPSYDHNANHAARNDIVKGEISIAYFSFASLKDDPGKPHTGEIITFMDYELFEKWKNQPWKKRDEEYENFKQSITDKLLDLAEKLYPGYKSLVDFTEVGTPLTNESFTGHYKGVIYGMPGVPERFDLEKSPWCRVNTPVKNLYLAGADACATGVADGMSGGLFAAMQILSPWQVIRAMLN